MWKVISVEEDPNGCVRDDMARKGLTDEMTSDRNEWRKKTCCADPK